jgi:RHS repeat-associated protein
VQTEEGIARRNGSSYSYEFNLKDHLGNTRATFYKNPSSGSLQVVQRDDYYAFGSQQIVMPSTNKYLYNGKELQEELKQYDYGARFYDPVIARWNSVDPMAEENYSWTPYRYGFNNPVKFTDPTGAIEVIGPYGAKVDINSADYWSADGNIAYKGSTYTADAFKAALPDIAEVYFQGLTDSQALLDRVNSEDPKKPKDGSGNKAANQGGRPDADGFITKNEAINWWEHGNGVTLNANLNQLDLSKVYASEFSGIGSKLVVNLSLRSNGWDALAHTRAYDGGWVYGNITLKLVGPNEVRAYQDFYDFDYKSNLNPLNWARNLDTWIGRLANGDGTPYHINLNGSAFIQSQPLPIK